MQGWKKFYQANVPPKTGRSSILLSDKVDIKHKLVEETKKFTSN
jgi:hypothetical protein